MFTKRTKIIFSVISILAVFAFSVISYRIYKYTTYGSQNYVGAIYAYFEDKELHQWRIEGYAEKLKEAYEGGMYAEQTPEETFDLFIDALKEDDLKTASRYFVPGYQSAALDMLRTSKENDVLPILVEHADDRKVWATGDNTEVAIYWDDERGPFRFYLIQSEVTGLWKIEL